MDASTRWGQVGGNAAVSYQRQLVPGMFAPWAPALVDLAALRPGEAVLDVACGTGVVARLAAERVGTEGRVTGLDLNGEMLEVAQSLPPGGGAPIEWQQANALAMPLPDAAFDAVLCQHGLQQFPDRIAALREMRRVLRAAGRLAVAVWGPLPENPGMAALVEALERHIGIPAAQNRRAPFALSDPGEVRALIAGAGFGEVSLRTIVLPARFPSPEDFVEAQLTATPLSTLGALSDESRAAVASAVRDALRDYLDADGITFPMTAHLALAQAP